MGRERRYIRRELTWCPVGIYGILRPVSRLWIGLKYALAGFGALIWIGMWWDRSIWLGLAQLLIIIPALWYEIARRHS